jgi:PKD repeat protein
VNCDVNPCNITAKYEYRKDSLDCKKVQFINLSTPISPNVHFVWKFGDGGTSNDVNPAHVYSQPGKYYVCLVSEAGTNCRREYCDTVIVNCETPCNIQPNFTWRADSLVPSKIYFKNLTLSTVVAIHYSWKFGDGTGSNDINPTHVYSQPGKYTVCLVAEIGNTCRREICKQIEVAGSCNVFAKFERRHDATQWNNVWFNNLSQPVSNIRQTYWYYGDGATSQDFNTFHKYDKPGVYQVCLKVVSLNGCTSSYCDSVRIVKPDSCVINGKFGHQPVGLPMLNERFEALYNSNTAKYKWSFGDSTFGEGRIVSHRYERPGKYNVCLTITDGACKITSCETIAVGILMAVGGRVTQASIWPNPAMSTVALDVPLEKPEQVQIRFLDGNGAVMRQFNKSGATGNNRFTLSVDGLSQGLYLVEIRTNTRKWFSRFQKG